MLFGYGYATRMVKQIVHWKYTNDQGGHTRGRGLSLGLWLFLGPCALLTRACAYLRLLVCLCTQPQYTPSNYTDVVGSEAESYCFVTRTSLVQFETLKILSFYLVVPWSLA